MRFTRLLSIVGDEPVFETGLLLAGDVDAGEVRQQLSRWVAAGRLYQLRRGLYALAPPFQKAPPHPFVIANHLQQGSYVSCQSAMAHYGLIPEYVPVVTSITSGRPSAWDTPLGRFEYRHVKPAMLRAYHRQSVARRQDAFLAVPEKALLDLVYLQPGGDNPDYLAELRLQGLERLDLDRLVQLARDLSIPKLVRAAQAVALLARQEQAEYVSL
jgi:hypothetical protein